MNDFPEFLSVILTTSEVLFTTVNITLTLPGYVTEDIVFIVSCDDALNTLTVVFLETLL